jgi:spermidine/putrescine-binding protein
MKKLILALILLSATLTGCATKDKATLKVFNWGVYIDETVIKDFETLYNVNVIYDNYDSNESMYTKLQSGEVYDILVPTDWMVERLISEKKLQKIDLNKIPNLANVDPGLLNRTFDQGNKYSVPYFGATLGSSTTKTTSPKRILPDGACWIIRNTRTRSTSTTANATSS